MVWVPLLVVLTILASLTVCFAGAAINVYYRDIAQLLPVAAFAADVCVAGDLSARSGAQKADRRAKRGRVVEFVVHAVFAQSARRHHRRFPASGADRRRTRLGHARPGRVHDLVGLPVSYAIFKRAESWFVDVI